MAAWRLYRYRNRDGSSKDWAVKTNPDGSITTRWGKTADRLPGVSTRNGIRQFDIEKQKQAKGYVFVAEVDIDVDGVVVLPRALQTGTSSVTAMAIPAEPKPDLSPSPIEALYWHIECNAEPAVCIALGIAVRRLIGDIQAVQHSELDDRVVPNTRPSMQVCEDWDGWQTLIDYTLNAKPFTLSGQIKPLHGALPWLFFLALKQHGCAGVEIDMASESGREISMDLKSETAVLDFFGTDLECIRPVAEILGLLKPRLNLASALSDAYDYWF